MLLKDVLTLEDFKGAQVVAGENWLDNDINSVTILEAISDEVIKWIKEGELFLSCLYRVSPDVDQQIRIIRLLYSRKASGLIIFSVDDFPPGLSPQLIQEADTIGLPLILMPPEVSYEQVLKSLTLLNIRNNDLSVALQIQRTMNLMTLKKEGIETLLHFLMNTLRKEIAFLDNSGRITWVSGKARIEKLPKSFSQTPENDHSPAIQYESRCLRYAIITRGDYYGSILVFDVEKSEIEWMDLILSNMVLPITLTNIQKTGIPSKNHLSARELEINNFFTTLLSKKYENIPNMIEQAEQIGASLYGKRILILVQFEKAVERDCFSKIENYIAGENRQNELYMFNNSLLLLLFAGTSAEAGGRGSPPDTLLNEREESDEYRTRRVCNALLGRVGKGIEVHIGLSNVYENINELEANYRQALQAIRIGKILYPGQQYIEYQELGVYAMLCDHYSPSREGVGVQKDLVRLREYDEKHEGHYVKTLQNLSIVNENIETIAGAMNVHKNTLLYRKNKIIEILEHDPFSMPLKFNYQAFFMAKKLTALD
ncbi:CdaR family transcriptional regulator [Spirochaetia bacterium]|nr:CdaR family transcriptional regulator [Spirochaetia bacterium]